MSRTLNYTKGRLTTQVKVPLVTCGTFETRSTRQTIDDHYSFYSDIKNLKLFIDNERSNVTWSSPLFEHINDLLVDMAIIKSSWRNNLFNIGKNKRLFVSIYFIKTIHFISYKKECDLIFLVNFRQQTTHDNNNAQQTITLLSRFVHLSNVKKLEFPSTFDVNRWKDIQFILQYVHLIYKRKYF
jgi:hypothetical protein